MRLFPLSAFRVCFSAGVLLSLVQSAQPKGHTGGLQVKTNTDYPETFKSVPELCFVVAKIIFKSMSEFREQLSGRDLYILGGDYVDENNSRLHISVDDFMGLLCKPVVVNYKRDTLYNVLTELTFFELVKLDMSTCSAEVALIVRIVELLAQSDNGVVYMIYTIHIGTKWGVDLGMLARAVAKGEVMCDALFLQVINNFGSEHVKGWKKIEFEGRGRMTEAQLDSGEHLAKMERIRNFRIKNEEKKYFDNAGRLPSISLISSLFPILRRELNRFASCCSYDYLIQYETILSKLPRELIWAIIDSAEIKKLEATPSLKATYCDLCVDDQAFFKGKILSKWSSIEKELRSEKLDLKRVRSRDINFSIISQFSSFNHSSYILEVFDKQVYFKEVFDKAYGSPVFIRKRKGKYEVIRCKIGEELFFDLEGGDEIFLGRFSSDANVKYLGKMLSLCTSEMMNFLLYNLGFDHWMIIGNL